jgi:hypothetical protein
MIGIIVGIVVFILVVYILSVYFGSGKYLSNYAPANATVMIPASSISNSTSQNFTYSIWIYISDWTTDSSKTIFSRDGRKPIMKLRRFEDILDTTLQLANGQTVTCSVPNIQLQKWTNLLISVSDQSLDTYVNGKLVKTCVLESFAAIPTSDNAAVYLTPDGGFSGYTSRFRYWGEAVNPQEAWNVYKQGPGGNMFTNFLGTYKLQLNFIKGTDTAASITI